MSILFFDVNGKVGELHYPSVLGTLTKASAIKVGDRITELDAVVVKRKDSDTSIVFTCEYRDGTTDDSIYAPGDLEYINPPED